MGVLVARFAGANEPEKVNRVVYQAFITALALSVLMAVVGYFAAPSLLNLVKAAPEVQREALPFLRAMFLGIFGMMLFFMLSGAFRAAGDPRTPMRLGVAMTILTIVLNVLLIPIFGTVGAAMGTIASSTIVAVFGIRQLFAAGFGDSLPSRHGHRAGLRDHPIAVPLRAADRRAGHRHEHRRHPAAALHRIARAQRRRAGRVRGRLHRVVLVHYVDVRRLDGRGRDHRRPESWRRAIPSAPNTASPWPRRIGIGVAAFVGSLFLIVPGLLLSVFGMTDALVTSLGVELLRYLSVSGLFITVALCYTGGLQGTGDTRSPLYISIVSQIVIPVGLCTLLQSMRPLHAADIWIAIVIGHFTRALLSVIRFRQGRWRQISVDIEPART